MYSSPCLDSDWLEGISYSYYIIKIRHLWLILKCESILLLFYILQGFSERNIDLPYPFSVPCSMSSYL